MEFNPAAAQFAMRVEIDENIMGDNHGGAQPPVVIGNIYENPELLK